jgi:hypothetical protein
MNRKIIAVYLSLAVIGGAAIFTLPFRNNQPMPESGLTTEPCTLDLEVARIEEEIESRKAILDSVLETAELVKEARVVSTESTEIPTETDTETHETETEVETTTEEETSEFEPITEHIYKPVDSMMAPDLQAWVYAYCSAEGVDPYIVMAICERESCCIANIYGDNGRAYGIMQVQVRWVQDKISNHGYTNEMMLQAQPNIVIGTEIMKDYLNTGNGYEWALMAYNGGTQLVGTESTREYASWVLARAEQLRRQNNG